MALTMIAIHDLLEPSATALGYDLVAVEMAGSDSAILRVFIDSTNGIGVEDCAKASRQFGAVLDVEDPISNKYTLEVSSPGLDRPLVTIEHFQNAIGEKIKVRLMSPQDGRRRFKGVVHTVEDNIVTVDVDGEQFALPIDDMDKARLVPDFSSLPSVDA